MSVYIKGMEMPKGDQPTWIILHSDGTVEYNEICQSNSVGWKFLMQAAIPVPDHGRLIDADALIKSDRMVGKMMMYGGEYVYCQAEIDRAPTIIPADGYAKQDNLRAEIEMMADKEAGE